MRFSFAPIAINTITPNDRRRLIVFIATVTPLHKSRHCTLCLHRPHTTLVPDSWSWQIYVPWGQKIAACALCRVGEGREWQRENRRTRGGRETYATEQDSRVTVWLRGESARRRKAHVSLDATCRSCRQVVMHCRPAYLGNIFPEVMFKSIWTYVCTNNLQTLKLMWLHSWVTNSENE